MANIISISYSLNAWVRGIIPLFCHSPEGQSLEALSVSQYKLSY